MFGAGDFDRPSTWVPFKPKLCDDCFGGCCHLPLEASIDDLIRMELATEDDRHSIKKLASRLEKAGTIQNYRAKTGLFMISQKPDRSCIYLGSDARCTIYDKRPDVCRKFPTQLSPRLGFCPYKRKQTPK